MFTPRNRQLVLGALVASAVVVSGLAAGPATAAPPGPQLNGRVLADGSAVRGATVELMLAGSEPGEASVLAATTTDNGGGFRFRVPASVDADDVLYATAAGGTVRGRALPGEVELATSLGDIRSGHVVVNELTTVAAGASLAQFVADGDVGGAAPGLQNAAKMPRNLVDLVNGMTSRFLLTEPNGTSTETLSTFNALGSIIAGCVAGTNDCDAFLDAATDAWGVRPATTWEAMATIPTNPSGDPEGIQAQVPATPLYTPSRTTAPAGWYLALKFWGDGRQFGGPGNVAFDADGRVWANTNVTWAKKPQDVCPGEKIERLDPYAPRHPMDAFTGGGLNGSGFGIAFDTSEQLWVTNFGFSGPDCPVEPNSNSVSLFDLDGEALSPDTGYLDGPLSWPQGVISLTNGDVWIANCGLDNVVVYPEGDPSQARTLSTQVPRVFDVAQNAEGNVFATANGHDAVYGFTPDGTPMTNSPFGDSSTFDKPLGVASDRLGNVWVSNSGLIDIPCRTDTELGVPGPTTPFDGSVALVGPDGEITTFEGGGITIPWGIAVDGDDNVWVANFAQRRLSQFCGARVETCPTGVVGDAMSPDGTGYAFDGLQRNTGVQVDGSGNVWLANNWKNIIIPTDPFGDGLVVFLGMAAPIAMPLIGTPQLP